MLQIFMPIAGSVGKGVSMHAGAAILHAELEYGVGRSRRASQTISVSMVWISPRLLDHLPDVRSIYNVCDWAIRLFANDISMISGYNAMNVTPSASPPVPPSLAQTVLGPRSPRAPDTGPYSSHTRPAPPSSLLTSPRSHANRAPTSGP